MIFIVNGAPGSGKTSFEDYVTTIMGDQYCTKISTIDFVKNLAMQCGWDGVKTPRNRKFLSDLKDLLTKWDDVPYKKVIKQIKLELVEWSNYGIDTNKTAIFVDCREPEEIAKFVSNLNTKTVLVRRISAEEDKTSNHADANVLKYANYDYVLDNNGTLKELYQKCIEFVDFYHLHKKEGLE